MFKKIDPAIGKSQNLLIDKLKGTVLEGDETSGYIIAPFYRKVAELQLTSEEKTEIKRGTQK